MRTAIFSIISPNYRAHARLLMDSARRHHPEWDRFVLFVDSSPDPAPDETGFAPVPLDALPLPNRKQFCFKYTILELNTAVKPWMFEYLFGRGYDRVVYIDPDIVLFSPLEELDAGPSETFLTLTPHLTGPIGGDEHPSERTILQAGTYNLGFLAVRRQPALGDFLSWWQERLEHQCVVEIERGLFVDQKWIDLAPGLFPGVTVLRHDGYNVAYWNLAQRVVTSREGSFTVNGQPLRFFHFSGYDPGLTGMVSKHHHSLALADVGDARLLLDAYGSSLLAAGYESFRKLPYAFGAFGSGTRIADAARVAYRGSADLFAKAGDDPFARAELFSGYRDEARRGTFAARMGVASYRFFSQARPLVKLMPESFRRSLRETLLGRRESVTAARKRAPVITKPGLNIVGYLERETGVAESARRSRAACEAGGIPNHPIDVDMEGGIVQGAVHRTSIFHVNADQILNVRNRFPHLFESDSFRIGCWHWELPELPHEWIASAEPLNEIWAPSLFIQSALSRSLPIPVVHMPHAVEITALERCSPQEFGVPAGQFTLLCMFDLASVPERKNPQGAVEAFRRAFPAGSSAALLVKVSQSDKYAAEFAELASQLRGIPNVYLTDTMLVRSRVNGLIDACDGVISLHRSEGYGLILAEAMYLGKPVIATGWSGNMDFMNVSNSCVVGYDLVSLDRNYGPYRSGQQWAEPDVDHAAQLVRRLFDDSSYRKLTGERGRATIRTHFSPAVAGLRYARRLAQLGLASQR